MKIVFRDFNLRCSEVNQNRLFVSKNGDVEYLFPINVDDVGFLSSTCTIC
jgi:hypothetical protein